MTRTTANGLGGYRARDGGRRELRAAWLAEEAQGPERWHDLGIHWHCSVVVRELPPKSLEARHVWPADSGPPEYTVAWSPDEAVAWLRHVYAEHDLYAHERRVFADPEHVIAADYFRSGEGWGLNFVLGASRHVTVLVQEIGLGTGCPHPGSRCTEPGSTEVISG